LAKSAPNRYEKDITQCSKLYEGFKDADKVVTSVFAVIDKYFQEYPLEPMAVVDLEKSTEQMRAGVSMDLNPPLKSAEIITLLKKISDTLLKGNSKLKGTVASLHSRFDQFLSDSDPETSKEALYDLHDSLIEEALLEQDLATFLFSLALSSFYRQHLKHSSEVLRTDLWEGGNCPLCGEKPHFGTLRAEDGAKQLECWLCGTDWVHSRVKCPYCNNEERDELGYFTVEDNDICRVQYCKSCCQYYKVFDARKFAADGDVFLPIHNLATLAYDLLARQEGFTPGSGMKWVNESELQERQD
jgi:formate dehydrogenase accessory protein FdhE